MKADTQKASHDTYPTPEHGWTCFHCGESFPGNFGGQRDARLHFGALPDATPGCLLRMQPGEKPLLRRIRFLETELEELRARDDDDDKRNNDPENLMVLPNQAAHARLHGFGRKKDKQL